MILSNPPGDQLSNFALPQVTYINPSGPILLYNRWNVITASSACNAKLPPPVLGKVIGIRLDPSSTNLFTLNPNASENIGPGTNSSRILWAGESAILLSDGKNWNKVAGLSFPMICEMNPTANTTIANGGGWTQVSLAQAPVDNTGLMGDTTTNFRVNILRTATYNVLTQAYWPSAPSTGSYYSLAGPSGPGVPNLILPTAVWGFAITQQIQGILALTAGGNLCFFGANTTSANQSMYGASSDTTTRMTIEEIPAW